MEDKIMCSYNPDTKQIEVILTPEQAKRLAAEIEAHLKWFETVAIPLYDRVFGA